MAVASVRRRRLGAELRRLRERMGLSAEQAGERLSWSSSKISRIENARIGASVSDIRHLLEVYEVGESRRGEILALADSARKEGWWADYRAELSSNYAAYIALEDEADTVFHFECSIVPGLLQIREYARSLVAGWSRAIRPIPERRVDRLVDVRVRRQELLRKQSPLRLNVVLDESVLLRRVGSLETMRKQLDHIVGTAVALPNVDVRVLPLDRDSDFIMSESFMLMEFSPAYDTTFPNVVHTENLNSVDLEDEMATHSYRLAWQQLVDHALSFEESMELISRVSEERWRR